MVTTKPRVRRPLQRHAKELAMAERAIARAAELYAWTGHDELYRKTAELWQHARLARETVDLVVEARAAS